MSLCLFLSCDRHDSVVISREEYNKLKKLPLEKLLEIGEYGDNSIVTGSDGHQYYSQGVGGYSRQRIYIHYVDCKLCVKRSKQRQL